MKPLKRKQRTQDNSLNISNIKQEVEEPKSLVTEVPQKKSKPGLQNDENGNDMVDLTEEKPKTHPCKLCNEAFGSMDELIMHAKIEHTPRKQKTFSPEDIEYFLRVFLKSKKSHCPICHKAILNTLNWRGHLYKHCVVKNVACRVCGKSFTRTDHCKNHEARHLVKAEDAANSNDTDESDE